VLYQHGRFNAVDTARAAGALRFYALGLSGYAALKVLVNAFYALDRRKTPMLVSFMAVGLNLAFNWLFTFQLGWGVRGLAFATGCVASCNFLALYWLMRGLLRGLESGRMLKMLSKVALASAALAAVCWASQHWLLSAGWSTERLPVKIALLLLTIASAGLAFVWCGIALRIDELVDLTSAVRRRLRRA